MLTKTRTLASVSALATNEIECTFHDTVKDGDEILSRKSHIEVFQVGADISEQDPRVQSIAAATWTPASMTALTASIVAQATAETAERNAAKAASEAARIAAEAAKAAADAVGAAPQDTPTVDDLQIRLALTATGLRESVEVAVATGPQNVQDWYERARKFKRNDPMVIAMGSTLGVSDAQLDALWALAATK